MDFSPVRADAVSGAAGQRVDVALVSGRKEAEFQRRRAAVDDQDGVDRNDQLLEEKFLRRLDVYVIANVGRRVMRRGYSLVAECFEWVDLGGTVDRNPAGQQSDADEEQGDDQQRCRVVGLHAE